MKKFALALLTSATFFVPNALAEDTVEEQIEQLYQDFDNEMAPFVGVFLRSGSRIMLKRQYDRRSQNYYAYCQQQFDGNSLCDDFNKSFESWLSIGDVIRICSKNPRRCIHNPY